MRMDNQRYIDLVARKYLRMIFYWQVSVPRPARRNDYHEMELLRPR